LYLHLKENARISLSCLKEHRALLAGKYAFFFSAGANADQEQDALTSRQDGVLVYIPIF